VYFLSFMLNYVGKLYAFIMKGKFIMSIVTKSELVSRVARETKLTESAVEKVVASLLDAVAETLKKGDDMRLTGFGTFSVQSVAARTGRNPRTGEALQIKASKKPVFKAGKTLKDSVAV
jgi:DNA-binding protein HU-beta